MNHTYLKIIKLQGKVFNLFSDRKNYAADYYRHLWLKFTTLVSIRKFLFHDCTQVTRDTHLYLKDIEEREEGGTPAIVESIRAGMVFQLKQVR